MRFSWIAGYCFFNQDMARVSVGALAIFCFCISFGR
jgi:hypothetical protein